MYLQVELPALTGGTQAWVENIGHMLIKEVEVEIGGQRIDRHFGLWLHIWSELTTPAELENTFNKMIGNTADLTTQATTVDAATLYVPLQFWFCKKPGLALPLIALQFHEVKVNFEFRPLSELVITSVGTTNPVNLTSASLFVDYVFLDTEERTTFSQISHEYLIEQLQFTGNEAFNSTNVRQKLNFNHPVKELIFVPQLDSNLAAGKLSDFSDAGSDHLVDAKLQLNGHDRISTRKAGYFNLVNCARNNIELMVY